MIKKIGKKGIALIIAFIISIILAAVISNCLNLIFTKKPEYILDLTPQKIVNEIVVDEATREMFVLIIFAFMSFALISMFRLFKLNNYHAKTYQVTPEIEIPLPVGKNQTQHGSAWWLDKRKFSENFGVNTLDPENPTIKSLLDEKATNKVEPIFTKGGLTVGKKDRTKYSFKVKISKFKIPYLKISKRKVEDIYYIADNLHSLTIGATRSGKTRSIVLESINNIALAGESMIISDPKRRTISIQL
ncbi:MAG: type IV secretory system conjugative DNA transfer family protein [Clostridia bacterium]|nr:type IV secretory system conjugative DNA transfer family protein [Clostridia bacterium]